MKAVAITAVLVAGVCLIAAKSIVERPHWELWVMATDVMGRPLDKLRLPPYMKYETLLDCEIDALSAPTVIAPPGIKYEYLCIRQGPREQETSLGR